MATEDAGAEEVKKEPIETKAKEEEEKPKRAENVCCYSQKECNLEKLKGFDFCHKHILEDKASPFKPCSFISKTTGKCTNPAPNISGKGKTYCLVHMKDSELRKAIEVKSKKRKRKHSDQSEVTTEPAVIAKPTKLPTKKHKSNEQGEIPKRDETLRVDNSWHGDHESDTESLDNEIDDPLRHAGVWTAEEVTKVCRDKLLRLRSLYMSQFERLKHVYKNKRRKYILATKAQEEAGPNVVTKKASVSACDIAIKAYNKRYRTDALLQKQSKERRLGPTSKSHQILPHQRCTHYNDGNRCIYKIVPSTKFCIKHICHDPNQVLFLPCSHSQGDHDRCDTPVPNVLRHDKCLFHLPHDNLAADNLQENLEKARELQTIKDKEKEEKLKKELQERTNAINRASVVKSEPNTSCDSTPGVAPGVVAPGVVAPGVVAPGVVAPGVIAPGAVAPGVKASGVIAPGAVAPGVVAPGGVTPGVVAPGVTSSVLPSTAQADPSNLSCSTSKQDDETQLPAVDNRPATENPVTTNAPKKPLEKISNVKKEIPDPQLENTIMNDDKAS